MSSAAGPWSVKGIDPRAREIAKDLARRSGLTLGEWLNQKIVDDEVTPPYAARRPAEPAPPVQRMTSFSRPEPQDFRAEELSRVQEAIESLTERVEAAERRSTLAIGGIDQSVVGMVSRLEAVERDQGAVAARFDGALDELRTELARGAERARRSEQTESVRMEASKALEAALGKVASQLYESEERTRSALTEIREDLTGVVRRMERVDARFEADGGMMENLIARIAEKLSEAEAATADAVKGLEESFSGLGARVATAEARLQAQGDAEPLEAKFEKLAADLSGKVEQARADMTERQTASDGKFDRMETALRNLGGVVDQAERRSAQAIDRMGREVMRIAQTLGGRVAAVEARGAEAVEQVGGEMARIADAMENRLRQADTAQAAALEKLGGEIGRIAERLAERIASAERRSAETADSMGDHVARMADKLGQRHEQAAAEFAERIRQSEDRTARLLQDAQAKLDQRLADAQRNVALEALRDAEAKARAKREAAFATHAPPPVNLDPFPSITRVEMQPFAALPEDVQAKPATALAEECSFAQDEIFPDALSDEEAFAASLEAGYRDEDAAAPGQADEAPEAAKDELFAEHDQVAASHDEHEPFEAAQSYLPEADADAAMTAAGEAAPSAIDESLFEPEAEPAAARDSTRQMIESARAAARQGSGDGKGRRARAAEAGSVTAPAFEAGALSNFFKRKKKTASGSTLRTALLASGTAATLGMAAAGYWVLTANDAGSGHPQPVKAPSSATAAAPQADNGDMAAIALAESLSDTAPPAPEIGPELRAAAPAPTPAQTAAPADAAPPKPIALAAATQKPAPRVAPARATGRAAPTPAAPPAPAPDVPPAVAQIPPQQSPARSLYGAAVRQIETGDNAGMNSLRQAANLGYAPAQFYLGKLYETGGGGLAKNPVEARRWTERAAQGGDPKAMHNLALYYFEGEGGPKNATMAATWFRRAAELGLQDSQYNLARLHEQGYGVAQSPADAYKWYLIAASNGDADARAGAERVKKQISVDAQAAAERSAAALRAQITGTARSAQSVAQVQ